MEYTNIGPDVLDRMRATTGVDSDSKLAKILGRAPSSVNNWRLKGGIPVSVCASFADQYSVSMDWLIFGQPTKHNTESGPCDDCTNVIPLYDVEGAAGAGRSLDHETVIGSFQLDTDTVFQLGVNDVRLAGVRVRGDSMEPTLTDNDWVIVNLDEHSYMRGGVFLIWVSGELRIKRLQRVAGGAVLLISDNKLYEREMIAPDNMQDFSVLGRVVLRLGEIS